MDHRTAAWLAWSLWALSLALIALGLLLLVLNSPHPGILTHPFRAENILLSVGFSTVGAVIVPRVPTENPIGWLFCAIGLLWAAIHFSGEYAIYTLVVEPGSLPAGEAASWVYSWPWVLSLGLTVLLGLLFPDGRFLSDRWRRYARLSALLTAVGTVLAAFSPGPLIGIPAIHNPLGVERLPNAFIPVQAMMLVLVAGAVVSSLMRRVYARG